MSCTATGTNSCGEVTLPVYEVTATGIGEEQANILADALKIPAKKLFFREGIAAFVDPGNYLAIPTVTVSDTELVERLRRETKNFFPDKPQQVNDVIGIMVSLFFLIREDIIRKRHNAATKRRFG